MAKLNWDTTTELSEMMEYLANYGVDWDGDDEPEKIRAFPDDYLMSDWKEQALRLGLADVLLCHVDAEYLQSLKFHFREMMLSRASKRAYIGFCERLVRDCTDNPTFGSTTAITQAAIALLVQTHPDAYCHSLLAMIAPLMAAFNLPGGFGRGMRTTACHRIREILRDPWHPLWEGVKLGSQYDTVQWYPKILRMAAQIESERHYSQCPILADMMEEAGCVDSRLLDHLRGENKHFLGCWALDIILGRGT